ncbi:MAG: ABC transporter permease subunit [Bdellovibrionaceae bacterium]|nr:ABC transporter permease subunit [Pseudobdellovibrionaceae bacterium]MDW8189741.1 ABC transporter permease subunit [Pseudobdellovibrionaceae bacterium]
MFTFVVRRLLLMIPTFLGITLISFVIINLAPGSPIEQKIQAIRFGGGGEVGGASGSHSNSKGSVSLNEEILEALKKQYGFDKPILVRYWIWLRNIFTLDFGTSFTYEEPVLKVIVSKFPVSLQFGIASLILTYLICIPLGILKAVKAGTTFDVVSGLILYFFYAVPPLILGILLITFFAGGSYFSWFPTGLLYSDHYDELSFWGKVWDRVHHFVLPLTCYVLGGFASLTLLMRNSLLDVIKQDYIRTARAKGLDEKTILWKHALRNALIPLAVNLGGFLQVFLSGSLIIESVFQLDGIGLLSYMSILSRDYNVIMGLIFLSAVTLMLGRLLTDIVYVIIDPRIDFK